VNALVKAAANAVALAHPKKGESLLVVTDEPTMEIGAAIYEAAQKKCRATMFIIEPTGQSGREPPSLAAEAMRNADIVYCPTKYSLTHTEAARAAKAAGATVATLPGITRGVFIRGMSADYSRIKRDTTRLGKKLARARKARVIANGTDITFGLAGCKIQNDDGDLHRKSIHNLPGGESGVAPKKANGYFTAMDNHLTKKRVRFTVRNNRVIGVDNARLRKKLWSVKNATNVAEFSIGTNPSARLSGNVLEDEKVLGTCHIAVGDSKSMGGRVRAELHWDYIIQKPTIWLGKRKIMDGGRMR